MAAGRQQIQPRRQPRQRRSEETRDRILDAAIGVFAAYGYDRGTTNRIADWAEISIGSLYQYFPNKDAILAELAVRHLDAGIAAARDRRPAGSAIPLDEAIADMVTDTVDNHRHDPAFLRVVLERAPRTPELMAKVAELQDTSTTALQELLADHPEVNLGATDTAARLVVVTVESVVHQALAAPAALNADDLQRELTAMLTSYLTR
ncbi:TetR/AcrR family transcriptional regulator [Mycolicibacterium sp. S2-37]|uniref:TetR/AcrR family transcriptional regulator n=1 Tax=Mycolicibacterium sp. S2-37 TaxID=2810297 RepID=UPI001A93F91A|nr:TetR/AcrR family transcriptional regulator [Mycolicibacterium sp. S2-37]MBO0681353.1 TetR/AcrR family transcriptional regulator [Mycolicibacterium sp. S2-37]